ncbi:hypothetical protein GXW84_39350 [Rhodococcus sp. IEGM 248]|nr:hypothetical protein [Rhodococcus sp. IEGM 248]
MEWGTIVQSGNEDLYVLPVFVAADVVPDTTGATGIRQVPDVDEDMLFREDRAVNNHRIMLIAEAMGPAAGGRLSFSASADDPTGAAATLALRMAPAGRSRR